LKRSPWLAAVAIAVLVTGSARAAECANVHMADHVTVDGTPLVLNGMGLRTASIFNVEVYVAGLYLEHRTASAQEVIDSEQLKRLVFHFVRAVSRTELVVAIRQALAEAGASASITRQTAQLQRWLPSRLRNGQDLAFTYRPGVGLTVEVEGRVEGTLGVEFARAFFTSWFGAHAPNPALAAGLLGGHCG
jgi:hypothetical protein